MTRLEALEAVAKAAQALVNHADAEGPFHGWRFHRKGLSAALAALDAVPVEGPCLACDGRGVTNRHIPFPDPCPYCNGTGRTK